VSSPVTPPFLAERRRRATERWQVGNDVVLVAAGDPITIPGRDFPYPFQVHPQHRWLADSDIAGAVLAYDGAADQWELFAPRPDVDDRIWHAATPPVGRPLAELEGWLVERADRVVHRLGDEAADSPLSQALTELRLVKDDEELSRMRRAAAATAAGFDALYEAARPGVTEHQLRADVEAAFLKAGAERTAYDSIVAAGSNAAVLHFHPTHRAVEAGDWVLVDAGAEVGGYACDVTRTFTVGRPSDFQQTVWDVVVDAHRTAVAECRPGEEYREIHSRSATRMAAGLVEIGLLRGRPEALVADGAMALFFPHGVGHLIGLAVHDPGGYAPGRERSSLPGLRFLRTDRVLEAGMVVTIEPGIYFIEALLADPEQRRRHGDAVDWALVDEHLEIGGVRIEDTVLVTADGGDALTEAIPKRASIDVAAWTSPSA
jgi:Xaa-Pro aminopeptidase